MKLNKSYYLNDDVVVIAKDLVGKELFVRNKGETKSGFIVETEAYSFKERACHAFDFKRTKRTETMFKEGGVAYVYLCYGIHHLFNIVTNERNYPEAVLIRAIEPKSGLADKPRLTSGPGKLTRALGISIDHNSESLTGNAIWIEDVGIRPEIEISARIGVDYAGEDAKLPWRFSIKNNKWVSK